jgi:hypothetical protein
LRKVKKGKRGGKPEGKRELGFEGIKGWEEEKKGGFLVLGLRLDCRGKERLTGFLVGVGNPQHM